MTYNKNLSLFALAFASLWAAKASSAAPRASETAKLQELFQRAYYSDYEPGRCGQNIMGLLDAARKTGIDSRSARMIVIRNEGTSAFGMVNAENARGGYHIRTGKQLPPRDTNWYHHVILEMDCLVFDFDFMNEPTVIPLGQYLERMFLDETDSESGIQAGRETKLEDYQIKVLPAADYYADPDKAQPKEQGRLKHLARECQHRM